MSTMWSRVALVAGSALAAMGLIAWYVTSQLVIIGPYDRAEATWVVVVPLLALAPGVAGLAERTENLRQAARYIAAATALGLGLGATFVIVSSVSFANCRPVTSALDVLPQGLVGGLAVALTYFVPYRLAGTLARKNRPVAAALCGAALWVALAGLTLLIVYGVLFQPLACATPH